MAEKKTKKCGANGCRKKALWPNDLCPKHIAEKLEASPIEAVERMSDIEALSFKAMDAELRNYLLMIKNLDYELDGLRRKYQEEASTKTNHKKQVEALFNAKKTEYDQLVKEIAEKRGLDPTKMALDPEAKTIRDLRGEPQS